MYGDLTIACYHMESLTETNNSWNVLNICKMWLQLR
jgi:hypothetical protein